MTKSKIKKLIPIIFLLIVCSVLIYVYQKENKQNKLNNETSKEPPPVSSPLLRGRTGRGIASLEINNEIYETEITKEMSVYDFMTQLKNENKITFKDKNYSGMGKFIEEINGIKNGGKNWIYYVNNKKAEIGVSNYKIINGDIVSWKYEAY